MTTKYDVDDIIWNWVRWCWSGKHVGNMVPYIPWRDDFRPININQARQVDELLHRLQLHERMVVIAEYPQKNGRFADMHARQRMETARRWIAKTAKVWLTEKEYEACLRVFKNMIELEVA